MKKQKMNDDSLSLVLCWIKMQTNSLKTFVADLLDLFFFNDEAWFHFSEYVNLQNTLTWNAENP
jgi:hypothetical protein